MSIIISNIGKVEGTNEYRYELCVNKKVLATFTHNRADGLAVCLKKASAAAKKYQEVERGSLLDEIIATLAVSDFFD